MPISNWTVNTEGGQWYDIPDSVPSYYGLPSNVVVYSGWFACATNLYGTMTRSALGLHGVLDWTQRWRIGTGAGANFGAMILVNKQSATNAITGYLLQLTFGNADGIFGSTLGNKPLLVRASGGIFQTLFVGSTAQIPLSASLRVVWAVDATSLGGADIAWFFSNQLICRVRDMQTPVLVGSFYGFGATVNTAAACSHVIHSVTYNTLSASPLSVSTGYALSNWLVYPSNATSGVFALEMGNVSPYISVGTASVDPACYFYPGAAPLAGIDSYMPIVASGAGFLLVPQNRALTIIRANASQRGLTTGTLRSLVRLDQVRGQGGQTGFAALLFQQSASHVDVSGASGTSFYAFTMEVATGTFTLKKYASALSAIGTTPSLLTPTIASFAFVSLGTVVAMQVSWVTSASGVEIRANASDTLLSTVAAFTFTTYPSGLYSVVDASGPLLTTSGESLAATDNQGFVRVTFDNTSLSAG